jgi:hypothetical protein
MMMMWMMRIKQICGFRFRGGMRMWMHPLATAMLRRRLRRWPLTRRLGAAARGGVVHCVVGGGLPPARAARSATRWFRWTRRTWCPGCACGPPRATRTWTLKQKSWSPQQHAAAARAQAQPRAPLANAPLHHLAAASMLQPKATVPARVISSMRRAVTEATAPAATSTGMAALRRAAAAAMAAAAATMPTIRAGSL